MGWERITLSAAGGPAELPVRLEEVLAHQRAAWPELAAGEAALSGLASRAFEAEGARLVVQWNPGRRASTLARMDAEAIARRPCFLCPEHMPPEERGVAFGRLVVAPNPHPVLPGHCTAIFRAHEPQRLAGRLADLLELARATGPARLAFYNGPRCGASAPDHAHFQLVAADGVPLFSHLPPARGDGHLAWESLGRRMILGWHATREAAQAHLEETLAALGRVLAVADEPPLNLLVRWTPGRFLSALVPRRAHRPACFSAQGAARLSVSPAALEMAGLLVVSEPEHLARVDVSSARAIYEEVGLDAERFAALREALG